MKLSTNLIYSLYVISAASPSFCSASQHAISTADLKVPGESPLQYCNEDYGGDILQIEYFNVDPNPPQAGKNGTVDAAGTLSKDIEEGAYIKLHVNFGPITIIKTTVDLCAQVKSAEMECPLKKGPTKVLKEFSMPDEIPNGKWKVVADLYTKDDERISCVAAEVTYPVKTADEL